MATDLLLDDCQVKLSSLKPKRCKAPGCANTFFPSRPFVSWCAPECAVAIHYAKQAKKAAKEASEDRKRIAERRQKLKTIGQLEGECRKIVQKIARIRDRNDGCISCHMGPNYDGIWHGSHYRSHGSCSSLQMHLWNVHKACAQCNLFKSGNKGGYIRGLLAKPGYGRERLDWLDSQPKSKRFEREYLIRFKTVMGKRAKRLEKVLNR